MVEYQRKLPARLLTWPSTDKSAAAVTKDGRVYVWGSSDYGVMEIPKEIQGHVASITAGRGHFTVLLDDGTVTSWGWNNQGQSNAPSLSNVISVSSDYYQNYAIDANGKVSTWGLSGYLMGTDQYGRDLFTRLLSGGQVTMTIGAISVINRCFYRHCHWRHFPAITVERIDIILMRFGEIVNADSISSIGHYSLLSDWRRHTGNRKNGYDYGNFGAFKLAWPGKYCPCPDFSPAGK